MAVETRYTKTLTVAIREINTIKELLAFFSPAIVSTSRVY